MSWVKTTRAVRAELNKKNLPTSDLETLAREVPLKTTEEAVSAVGAAIEHVLCDRYVVDLAAATTDEILAECAVNPDQYTSRVDRARSDALQRVLEIRFPSEPDGPDPIDTYDETAGLTFGQHLANWYRSLDT